MQIKPRLWARQQCTARKHTIGIFPRHIRENPFAMFCCMTNFAIVKKEQIVEQFKKIRL